ncbi:hypothetical protein RN001_005178 [Aquatica leii]|uniref:Uncharacterized protein n=1 Tax=Aquatica leii TaxID=1421715 RepID=A0AAN7PC79_9COLE|nr:hypothetical protein RN001_005178 [Aquatica leii]
MLWKVHKEMGSNGVAFNDWKINVKRKSRKIKENFGKTGGGPCNNIKLTDLEEQLLNLISRIHLGDEEILDSLNLEGTGTAMDDDTNNLDIRTYETTSNEVEFETRNVSNLEETILTPAKQAVRLSNLKEKKTPRTTRSATASLKSAIEIYQKAQDADSEKLAIKLKIKKGHLKLKYYEIFKTFEGFEDFYNNI